MLLGQSCSTSHRLSGPDLNVADARRTCCTVCQGFTMFCGLANRETGDFGSSERGMRPAPGFIARRAFLSGACGLAGRQIVAQNRPDQHDASGPVVDESIGSDLELFVDHHRISSMDGVSLRLHAPKMAQPAIQFDRPWEGSTSAYVTVFEDQGRFRMYYRGSPGDGQSEQTCYAESDDGIEWRKPDARLFDWPGSSENNIVVRGLGTHNFTPFKDPRTGIPERARYKAVARGTDPKTVLHAFESADGLRWSLSSPTPVFTEGRFDSQNLAFWDANLGRYRCYFRRPYRGVRGIGVVESEDFLRWTGPKPIRLDPPLPEHFYTNATIPYFRNPRYYLAFPKRYLPERRRLRDHSSDGISEAVFLTSRDGLHFDRTFMEAWIRPGRDPRNWGDRSTMPAWGLLQTGQDELSVYISQHYRFDSAHLARATLRLDGFASAHADHSGGELITTPLRFTGRSLVLNYATAAAGCVRVELQTASGQPLPGFTLADAPCLYGDAIREAYQWEDGPDVSSLAQELVRIRFVMKDCDLYSYRFTQ